MFAFRLALPFLCWRTALAVRLAQVDEGLEEYQSRPRRGVKTAMFIQTKARAAAAPAPGSGNLGPIRDAVKLGFERGCIHELAMDREVFLREQNVTSRSAPRTGNISTALEAMFEAQDTADGSDDQSAEATVEQFGLSLDSAEEFCEANAGQPLHGVVQQCIKDFEARGRTRSRSWFRRGKGETDIETPHESLPMWLDERFDIDHTLLLLGLSSDSFVDGNTKAKEVRERFERELATNKVNIKATGFSVTHTKAHCKEIHAAETEQADEKYVERVSVELGRAVDVDGTCSEGEGVCPEATSPQHSRSFRWGRFGFAYTVGFLAVEAAIVGVGFFVGGGHGAALTGGLLALPVAEMTPLPFAALAGIPFLGMCSCNLNICEWNAEQEVCAFTTSEASTNPYQWLPYPGTKCEPAVNFDQSKPECAMTVCDVADFDDPARPETHGIFGKVGVGASKTGANNAVFNCLSDDGTRLGDLGMRETWVDSQTTEEVPNTPENRNSIYAKLNVARPSGAAGRKKKNHEPDEEVW